MWVCTYYVGIPTYIRTVHRQTDRLLLYMYILPTEASYKAETLGNELKEERNSVKTLKTELQQLKEELFDVKNEKEATEKVGVA